MLDSSQRKPMIFTPRARHLTLAALVGGVLVAGCGGSTASSSASAASAALSTTSRSNAATVSHTTSTRSNASNAGGSGLLAFSECMRANGVSDFPDPNPERGALFSLNGIDASSPVFKAAQARCRKLMPGGGPPGPGTQSHPSPQTMTKLLTIAECMRRHGVSDFPDPRTSVPLNPPDTTGVITDFDGVILLFPVTLNLQAPAYKQAITACGAPPLGLPH